MALLTLLILSVLVIGFLVLSSTEPTIANNHLMVAQARALAEAGVERAIWALNTDVIPTPLAGDAPAPYDGSQLVLTPIGGANFGGFRVTVTNGAVAYERVITSVGWVPNDTSAGSKAHQKVTVVLTNPSLVLRDPPAAVSVRGELDVGGNTLIDSRGDQSCGKKMGTLTLGLTNIMGNAADIWGATDNNNTRNEFTDASPSGNIPPDPHDLVTNVNTQTFDQYIMSDADINALRAYAKAMAAMEPPRGTYMLQTPGSQILFNTDNKLPNGVVFIDTTTGNNITQEGVTPATPSSEFANVKVAGNAMNGEYFSGVLFVNGKLTIDGNFKAHGLVYVQNDLTYHGIGTGQVDGAMISRNIRDTSPISIDSELDGNSKVYYNCAYAKNGGGTIQNRWSMKGGTYRELSGL